MARDFASGDFIDYGADASIGDFVTQTISLWIQMDVLGGNTKVMIAKNSSSQWFVIIISTGVLRFRHQWTTTEGVWQVTTPVLVIDTRYHIVITYNGGATTNDPVIYFNGISQTVTENTTPVGSLTADAAQSLTSPNLGTVPHYDGLQSHLAYDNTLWSAAEVNRAKWWGRPKGGLQVYQPLYTDKLINEGVATANGTATGSTVAPFAIPVVRPSSSMMGMGIGW